MHGPRLISEIGALGVQGAQSWMLLCEIEVADELVFYSRAEESRAGKLN